MSDKKLRIGVIGLGFGAEFVPIYLDHPDVESVAICDKDSDSLDHVTSRFGIKRTYKEFDELVAQDDLDAIHIVSGIPDHVSQTLATLNSGKHCACTVPMATTIDDLKAIIKAQQASNRNYMMMETSVYTRQFLYAKELRDKGEFGRIQFLRGAHYQDDEAWPWYWEGLPPMWYATHAVSPLLAIADCRATKVHCFGSGEMRDELVQRYGNPFPIETAIFQTSKPNLSAEVTRTLFYCARSYMEMFNVYGVDACLEWQMEWEPPVLFKASPVIPKQWRTETHEKVQVPDYAHLLPDSVGKYTKRFVYGEDAKHLSFEHGGGHHGSHPHMVNEFVRSIVEKRKPYIDSVTAANWCAAGICAHQSAMNGGEGEVIPIFE